MKIAVCIASRGFGSYRTIASLLPELEGVAHRFCWAIGLGIPDAQNECARQAREDPDVTHLWWVEDDNLLGSGFLAAMLALISPAQPLVAIDYLHRAEMPLVIRHPISGAVELVGMGCTLMLRSVLGLLPDPPFQVGNRFQWTGLDWQDMGVPEYIGGQDVALCRTVRAAGLSIGVVEGLQAGHLELVKRGGHVNFGMDEERCLGGEGLPWRPERRIRMATEYWQSPSGLTIDYDTDIAAEQIALREQAGWVRVNKGEAAPALKAQDKAAPEAPKGQ